MNPNTPSILVVSWFDGDTRLIMAAYLEIEKQFEPEAHIGLPEVGWQSMRCNRTEVLYRNARHVLHGKVPADQVIDELLAASREARPIDWMCLRNRNK